MLIAIYIVFIWAYFFNDMVFAVNINIYGEALIELVLLSTAFVIMSHGMYVQYKNLGGSM